MRPSRWTGWSQPSLYSNENLYSFERNDLYQTMPDPNLNFTTIFSMYRLLVEARESVVTCSISDRPSQVRSNYTATKVKCSCENGISEPRIIVKRAATAIWRKHYWKRYPMLTHIDHKPLRPITQMLLYSVASLIDYIIFWMTLYLLANYFFWKEMPHNLFRLLLRRTHSSVIWHYGGIYSSRHHGR